MEALRILGVSVLGAGVGVVISLIVGMSLLEVAFSLPFAVILGVVLFVLGVLLLINMSISVANSRKTKTTMSDTKFAACTALTMEIAVLAVIGFLTIAGGAFAIWIYLQSTALAAPARVGMYIVLGASVTVILSVNLLDLVEVILRWCHRIREKRKEKALREKQAPKEFGPLKLGGSSSSSSSTNFSSSTKENIATGQRRLFPLRAQNWLIIIVALATGLYYGYCYGSIAGKQLEAVTPGVTFNPVPVVVRYLEFTVPVAAVGGFVVVAIALMLPHLLLVHTNKAASNSKNDKSDSSSSNNGSGGTSSGNPAYGKSFAVTKGDEETGEREPQATDALLPKTPTASNPSNGNGGITAAATTGSLTTATSSSSVSTSTAGKLEKTGPSRRFTSTTTASNNNTNTNAGGR